MAQGQNCTLNPGPGAMKACNKSFVWEFFFLSPHRIIGAAIACVERPSP
eukprot:COSAG06_NODE_44027_length_366_cov_10.460674_2_plen_48_part_01